ncbi:MAG TPA: MoaD/ThiS family protein [Acidimicrobiales bacterium]|nr:MoaD/ThiS family protein [Acidimicrobiales bacterium]
MTPDAAVTPATSPVRVRLPAPLRELAQVAREITVEVPGDVTQRSVLDALERSHPALAGTTRDRASARRRAFIRFYVGEEDLSNASPDEPLPPGVAAGREPFVVIGAMAGG